MKAKKEAIKEQGKEEIGLSGTFLENIEDEFEERNKEKAEKALRRNESRNVKENIPEKQEGESKSVISRQNLIEEQSNDKELLDLFKIALTPVEDLGTKLSHLPSVQRKELAEVITQYRKVFPDIPSKTNSIEHDVDVGDSVPIKQHPYRVRPMKKELLDKEVQ